VSAPSRLAPSVRARRAADERRIGRLLITVTYVAVAILTVGVVAMLAAGISPLDPPPVIDLATIATGVASLRPEAILGVGIVVVVATPIIRVIAAAVTYARSGETRMLLISIAILAVILVGVVSASLTQG
jgi:uncharacterized membrane protein